MGTAACDATPRLEEDGYTMHLEHEVEIQASRDRAWEALIGVERWPLWTESMRLVRWLDGCRMSPGARALIQQPGLPATVWTVTAVLQGFSFTWKSARPGLTTVASHVLADSAGAAVTLTISIDQSGPLSPLASWLMQKRTRRYLRLEAEGLGRAAEDLSSRAASAEPG